MRSVSSKSPATRWLVENGPKELELLFRAIVYHPSAPILITDNDWQFQGRQRRRGQASWDFAGKDHRPPVDDFAAARFKPQISELWRAFQNRGNRKARSG